MNNYLDHTRTETTSKQNNVKVGWESPSNIALIKYWGKTGEQIPMNPSISMTLSKSLTRTIVLAEKKEAKNKEINLRYLFEGERHPDFELKTSALLKKLDTHFPFVYDYNFEIESANTFPHSAGIASSASSMSALALCLLSVEKIVCNRNLNVHAFIKKASHVARLGSGSACRSLYGNYVTWGKTNFLPRSGDLHASPAPIRIHPDFQTLNDSILVIDKKEKPVSSRAGHEKMDLHPFKKGRIQQANQNLRLITNALTSGDWNLFSSIVENESFTLHGLMMSSDPAYLLIKPNTLNAIEKINLFRKETDVKITFTLDAGPNLHILYPATHKQVVQELIQKELLEFCDSNYVIHDQIGAGPVKIL